MTEFDVTIQMMNGKPQGHRKGEGAEGAAAPSTKKKRAREEIGKEKEIIKRKEDSKEKGSRTSHSKNRLSWASSGN